MADWISRNDYCSTGVTKKEEDKMKRRKVIAMLLAGTLTLTQPLAAFASEDFVPD